VHKRVAHAPMEGGVGTKGRMACLVRVMNDEMMDWYFGVQQCVRRSLLNSDVHFKFGDEIRIYSASLAL